MAENKKSLLAEFSRKAMQRLQAKKVHKKQVLHVPGLDQDITIRSLTYNEIAECNEVDDSIDRGRSDKYGVYLAMVEPDLKAAAKEIKGLYVYCPEDTKGPLPEKVEAPKKSQKKEVER